MIEHASQIHSLTSGDFPFVPTPALLQNENGMQIRTPRSQIHSERPDSEGPDSEGPASERPASEGPDSEGPDSEGPASEGPDSEGPRA